MAERPGESGQVNDSPSFAERLKNAGDYVQLVGETGLPLMPAVAAEDCTGTVTVGTAGHLELAGTRGYLLDLGGELFPFPVRLECEARVTHINGGTRVGVFADRRTHRAEDGFIHVAYVSGFGPMTNPPRGEDWTGKRMGLSGGLRYHTGDPSPFCFLTTPVRNPQVPAPAVDPVSRIEPFVLVAIDIRPDGFTAYSGVTPLATDARDRLTAELGNTFRINDERVTPPYFGNRFGLFVLQGNGQFRNVRIVRLPE